MAQFRMIVMRHGESPLEGRDHERRLSPRGEWDATSTGEQCKDLGWKPELVFCSTAQRTRLTYKSVAFLFEPEPLLLLLPSFYNGRLQQLQNALSFLSPDVHTVLALGHNPGWSHLASQLSSKSISLHTANAALLSIEAPSWNDALGSIGGWKLEHFIQP